MCTGSKAQCFACGTRRKLERVACVRRNTPFSVAMVFTENIGVLLFERISKIAVLSLEEHRYTSQNV